MTLQSRLLGVFAQYPDPRVGVLTTEIVLASSTYMESMSSPYLNHTLARWADALDADIASVDKLLAGLVSARRGVESVRRKSGRSFAAGEKVFTDEEEVAFLRLPPLLGDEDARIVGMYWLEMIQNGEHWRRTGSWTERKRVSIAEPTKYDALVPWLARLVAVELRLVRKGSQDANALYRTLQRWPRELSQVADWAHATHPDLMRLTWNQATHRSRRWHAALAQKGHKAIPGEIVYRFADGWTLQRLPTMAHLKTESAAMQHCVGRTPTYYEGIQLGRLAIFSLRDSTGASVVTFELAQDRTVQQAKLRKNALPHTREICERIVEAASALGWYYSSPHLTYAHTYAYTQAEYDAAVEKMLSPDAKVRGQGIWAHDLRKCPGSPSEYGEEK